MPSIMIAVIFVLPSSYATPGGNLSSRQNAYLSYRHLIEKLYEFFENTVKMA